MFSVEITPSQIHLRFTHGEIFESRPNNLRNRIYLMTLAERMNNNKQVPTALKYHFERIGKPKLAEQVEIPKEFVETPVIEKVN